MKTCQDFCRTLYPAREVVCASDPGVVLCAHNLLRGSGSDRRRDFIEKTH
jgi:hypothetical protein